jgi:hypothetical protein
MSDLDVYNSKGPLSGINYDKTGAVLRTVPVVGVVKQNIDPFRTGRLMVYLQDNSGIETDDEDNWVKVYPVMSYWGHTLNINGSNEWGQPEATASYGMWQSPPDIGTSVLCVFAEGKPDYGYYIGAIPAIGTFRMVPAIAGVESPLASVPNPSEAESYGGAPLLPVSNQNTNNTEYSQAASILESPSPVHNYAAASYFAQGTLRDRYRGPITSSAERESPSRVWGVSTPGRPIYQGGYSDEQASSLNDSASVDSNGSTIVGRKGGHTFVMDDGDILGNDRLIRLRTSAGHQISMRDDSGNQFISIMHRSGHYIELGDSGTIDIWSPDSVNIASSGDLNLHSGGNISLHAEKDLRMVSNTGATTINTGTDYILHATGNHTGYAGGNWTEKAGGGLSMLAGGEASMKAGSAAYVNGSRVNLNTGSAGLTPTQPEKLKTVDHYGTKWDSVKGWLSEPGALKSIVSRLAWRFPWPGAGNGTGSGSEGA